jgi:hypothetical protein
MTDHDKALIAIQGATIQNLMDTLENIAKLAHDLDVPLIADLAEDAIEAAKALRGLKNNLT